MSVVITPPARDRAVRGEGTRVVVSRRDGDDSAEWAGIVRGCANDNGRGGIVRRAVAELTFVVASPTCDVAVRGEGTRVPDSRRHGDNSAEWAGIAGGTPHGGEGPRHRPISQLTTCVLSPACDVAGRGDDARVFESNGHLGMHRAEMALVGVARCGGLEDRRRPRGTDDQRGDRRYDTSRGSTLSTHHGWKLRVGDSRSHVVSW